ncbi:MAG: hypothetical protein ACTHMS_10155 [Jatrophihabitans sp.]|uniref:hypothetical protein n=1 Tax=Jatrophihabitans sp. TaxID=1932789 RepID=UPI003F7E9D36
MLIAPHACRQEHRLRPPNVRLTTERRKGVLRTCWTCQTCFDVIADDEVES